MKKKCCMVVAVLSLCLNGSLYVQAKQIEAGTYKMCKNDIFSDYWAFDTKKIVTQVEKDGVFHAKDLGIWLREQGDNLYHVTSQISENGVDEERHYELRCFECPEEYKESENTAYIDFQNLVQKGDVISFEDGKAETVTKIELNGDFYTITEIVVGAWIDE